MASLARPAKSPDEWTVVDLDAYNITILPDELISPYELNEPNVDIPLDVSPEFLEYDFSDKKSKNSIIYQDKLIRCIRYQDRLIKYIGVILDGEESVINDLAREMLIATGYEGSTGLVRTERSVSFVTSGEHRDVHIGTTISDIDGDIALFLHKNDTHDTRDPEPQIIAKAIAIFQENSKIINRKYEEPLTSATILCITMVKGFPKFYSIPVLEELSKCVQRSQYPTHSTVVRVCIPQILGKDMKIWMDPENRKTILRYYDRFRDKMNHRRIGSNAIRGGAIRTTLKSLTIL
jgi:hypothetical protein